MRRLAKLRHLPPSERRLVLAAVPRIVAFHLALRLFGIERVGRWVERAPAAARRPIDPAAVARNVERAANGLPFSASCLVRSLAIASMLRRRGCDARLRIGVRKDAGALDAHAWVEMHGRPLNALPHVAARYAPLAQWPAEGAPPR